MSGRYYIKNLWFSLDYLNLMQEYLHGTPRVITDISSINCYFGDVNNDTRQNNLTNYKKQTSMYDLQKKIHECSFFHKLKYLGKFESLYCILYSNIFNEKYTFLKKLELKSKINCINLFYKLQQVLYGLRKFIYIYRIKYKSRSYNSTSLILDEFKDDDITLKIYDMNNINYNSKKSITYYTFNACDLYNIVEKNIVSYDSYLVYDTIDLKNPYNNISFTYSQLWNIYFFLREKTIKHIPLFTLYFSCNFDKSLFILKHDYVLRNYIIDDYYKTISKKIKINIFRLILDEWYPIKIHHYQIKINVFNDFYNSKKNLIYDFLMYKYSYNINLSRYHLSQIKRILQETYDKNPLLGRRVRNTNDDGVRSYEVYNGNNKY